MSDPKPKRGMPRSLYFALIPAGFLLLILGLIFLGEGVQEDVVPETEREVQEE